MICNCVLSLPEGYDDNIFDCEQFKNIEHEESYAFYVEPSSAGRQQEQPRPTSDAEISGSVCWSLSEAISKSICCSTFQSNCVDPIIEEIKKNRAIAGETARNPEFPPKIFDFFLRNGRTNGMFYCDFSQLDDSDESAKHAIPVATPFIRNAIAILKKPTSPTDVPGRSGQKGKKRNLR